MYSWHLKFDNVNFPLFQKLTLLGYLAIVQGEKSDFCIPISWLFLIFGSTNQKRIKGQK